MLRFPLRITLWLASLLPLTSFAAPSVLSVDDPYVRLVPPSAPTSAAFMVIANAGTAGRQLVEAQSPAARTVELHSHVNDNGVMKMRQVPSIEIKAKGQAQLKPGGYHIMLIDLKPALKEGDSVPLTLIFDDGSRLEIKAPVRKIETRPMTDKAMGHAEMTH